MAGWEEELSVLLSELGVRQEEVQPHVRPTRQPMHSDVKHREQASDSSIWKTDGEFVDDESILDDLNMMRREVDAIVSQVVLLMQRADLDPAIKEDVMVVLRALRRHIPSSQQPIASDEAYLESASATLHFCRLVLQLNEIATEDL